MKTLTIRIASVVATMLVGVVATQAYPNTYRIDSSKLPLLVDKYYEIKHPDGPVTLTPAQIEELSKVQLTRRPGDFEVPVPNDHVIQFGF